MSDADHRPVDDQGGHHQGHQQGKGFPGHHIVNHHAKCRGDGGYRQGRPAWRQGDIIALKIYSANI